jgi:hypothetical protein
LRIVLEIDMETEAKGVDDAAGGGIVGITVGIDIIHDEGGIGVKVPVHTKRNGIERACLNATAVDIDVIKSDSEFPGAITTITA